MHSNLSRLKALPLLSVAAIDGQALGGGAEIATACDLRIMTRSAKIGFVQIRVGVTPGWSGGSRLVKICGITKSLDLLMSGRVIPSEEALNFGLISHIFNEFSESHQLIEETIEWLKQFINCENNYIIDLKKSLSDYHLRTD